MARQAASAQSSVTRNVTNLAVGQGRKGLPSIYKPGAISIVRIRTKLILPVAAPHRDTGMAGIGAARPQAVKDCVWPFDQWTDCKANIAQTPREVADICNRDVVQPPVFVTAALKRK